MRRNRGECTWIKDPSSLSQPTINVLLLPIASHFLCTANEVVTTWVFQMGGIGSCMQEWGLETWIRVVGREVSKVKEKKKRK